MKVVILAGGKGTRLGLTDVPKPMARVCGKTLLEHQIDLCARYGLKDIFILSGHLASAVFDHLGDGERFGVRISHVIEPRPLGTAGSLNLVRHLVGERFLVLYGDTILDLDLDQLIAFDKQKPAAGTLVVHPNNHPYDSDLLDVDADSYVKKVFPKHNRTDDYYRNLVNAALYVLGSEVFTAIPFGSASDFGRDILPAMVERGARFRAYQTAEYVHDVGTPDRLRKASEDVASGKVSRRNRAHKQKAIFLDRDGVLVSFVDNLMRPEELELCRGAADAVKLINGSDYLAVVVTNQPMLAKGFMTYDDLAAVHRKMETLLGREGAYLDAIFYCPHHPHAGFAGEVAALKIACDCRKPKAGMLFAAAREMNIELSDCWMIGDQATDIMCGKSAGCRTLLVQHDPQVGVDCGADARFSNIADAVTRALEYDNVRR